MQIVKSYNFMSFVAFFVAICIASFSEITDKYILYFKDLGILFTLLAICLSIFFARSKLLVLSLIPLFFNFYMFYPHVLLLDGGNHSFWYIYPITTAISFLFIGILPERGLFCFYGLSKILIIVFLLTISYYFLDTFSLNLKHVLDTKIISLNIDTFIKVNDFTFLITILSVIFSTIMGIIFFNSSIDKAPFWMLFALCIPSLFFQTQSSFIVFSTLSAIFAILALLKDLYNMSYIDTLTQIPARRALEEEFLKLGKKYSLAMVDIDFFKKFNDNYGHDVGDEVLKLVAEQINSVKGGGKSFRFGGEEFVILFANKSSNEVKIYLEEVREMIEARKFTLRDENRPKKLPEKKVKPKNTKKVKITVSIGIASSPNDGLKTKEVLKKADEMLYKAKGSGRNCTVST